MFERYTERARRVLFFARYEASQLGWHGHRIRAPAARPPARGERADQPDLSRRAQAPTTTPPARRWRDSLAAAAASWRRRRRCRSVARLQSRHSSTRREEADRLQVTRTSGPSTCCWACCTSTRVAWPARFWRGPGCALEAVTRVAIAPAATRHRPRESARRAGAGHHPPRAAGGIRGGAAAQRARVGAAATPAACGSTSARTRTDPTRWVLYEVYDSPEAHATHRQSPHFLAYDAVAARAVVDKTVIEVRGPARHLAGWLPGGASTET